MVRTLLGPTRFIQVTQVHTDKTSEVLTSPVVAGPTNVEGIKELLLSLVFLTECCYSLVVMHPVRATHYGTQILVC